MFQQYRIYIPRDSPHNSSRPSSCCLSSGPVPRSFQTTTPNVCLACDLNDPLRNPARDLDGSNESSNLMEIEELCNFLPFSQDCVGVVGLQI